MIITRECKATNKLGLLLELTRADEALLTLIEHEYGNDYETNITEETLEYMGLKFELKRNPDCDFDTSRVLFDELETLCLNLANEIEHNDWIIHYDKKYGYDEILEDYIKEGLVIE